MRFGVVARGPLSRPGRESLPFNRGLPLVYRYLRESRVEPAAQGPQARDALLAAVEADLFSADEPLGAAPSGAGRGARGRRRGAAAGAAVADLLRGER